MVESKKEFSKEDFEKMQKLRYIRNVSLGTIIAFTIPSGKVKSAMVVEKYPKENKLKVSTDYGAEFVVNYDEILWVKTGKRWPKGIFELLKKDSKGRRK